MPPDFKQAVSILPPVVISRYLRGAWRALITSKMQVDSKIIQFTFAPNFLNNFLTRSFM